MRLRLNLIGIAAIALLIGCDSGPSAYEQLGIATVTGRVTLDGEVLPRARVIFVEPGKGFSSVGETDSEGHYEMMLNTTQTGVAPGEKVVRITTGYSMDEDSLPGVETIPIQYNKKSALGADVKPSEAQVFNFNLTSDGEIEQPKVETALDQ